MTAYNVDDNWLEKNRKRLSDTLLRETVFGVGCGRHKKEQHPVMDEDWNIVEITKSEKNRAWEQLGTSGSGNHFVEFGVLEMGDKKFLAVLSHSGSRGVGARVCDHYASIAAGRCPDQPLPWLDINTSEGQEYLAAMKLMGLYASANHDVIHTLITRALGLDIVMVVENHHNFCWEEEHLGKKVFVHRKGATPAQAGVMGVIPGSMGSPAYVVIGKGNIESICSASHGAGRVLSRTQAKKKYNWKSVQGDLAKKGVDVISAGADEVPYVYKDIDAVMAVQTDLVDIIGRFTPKVVRMAGGGRAED